MRNDIGISHPTNYTINAFELLGWASTCVNEVLHDQPSEAAIQIKAFIDNLKVETAVIDPSKLSSILPEFKKMNSYHCSRILQTLFGIYVSLDTSQILRKNIASFASTIWELSQDAIKHKLGITIEGYKNNLHSFKYEKGSEFFDLVHGNNFRTQSEKIIALSGLTDELISANAGYDNYYYEVPIIAKILSYISSPKDLPVEISGELIKAVLKCRIGRGYSFENGVSPSGKPLYNQFFELMREDFVPEFLHILRRVDIRTKLRNSIAIHQLIEVLELIRKHIVTERFQEALDYLIATLPKKDEAMLDKDFQRITSSFMKW
jgi:hypothetical protein